jgi:hypothetical protein
MPSPRLIAVITALTCLAGASGAYAAYTVEQLRDIERLIVSKNCGGLRQYISSNPSLVQGNDPLASELRSFVSGVDTGLIDCLSRSAETVTRNAPVTSTSVASLQY